MIIWVNDIHKLPEYMAISEGIVMMGYCKGQSAPVILNSTSCPDNLDLTFEVSLTWTSLKKWLHKDRLIFGHTGWGSRTSFPFGRTKSIEGGFRTNWILGLRNCWPIPSDQFGIGLKISKMEDLTGKEILNKVENSLNARSSANKSYIAEDVVDEVPKQSPFPSINSKTSKMLSRQIDDLKISNEANQHQEIAKVSLGPSIPTRSTGNQSTSRTIIRHSYFQQVVRRLSKPNNFVQMTGHEPIQSTNPPPSTQSQTTSKLENIPKLIRLTDAYDEIKHQIKSDFEGNCGNFFLLTGASGHGKTSAVYYAANEIIADYKRKPDKTDKDHMPVLVEVDCMIYRDEIKIMARILDCFNNQGLPPLQATSSIENNAYVLLSKYFEQFKVMLYFKNVDVLAEESRQTFLYTLMESLKALARRYTIIFGTTNINFREKLDRRIWSRLSSKDFVFEETTIHGLNMVLRDRLSPTLKSDAMDCQKDATLMMKIVESLTIQSYLKRLLHLGVGVGWFLHLFKTAFILMGPNESLNGDTLFNKLLEHAEKDESMSEAPLTFLGLLERANSLITFESGYANMLNQLCHPQKIIVFTLLDHGISSGQDTVMSFDVLRRRQKELLFSHNSGSSDMSMLKKNRRGHLTDDSIKYSLTLLKTLGLVHLDKVPITMDTLVQLADCVNPCFISAKFFDNQVIFEGK